MNRISLHFYFGYCIINTSILNSCCFIWNACIDWNFFFCWDKTRYVQGAMTQIFFLGTKHKGEIFSLGNGKSLKGPITLPNCISFAIFKSTISLICKADFKFSQDWCFPSPLNSNLKPYEKPFKDNFSSHHDIQLNRVPKLSHWWVLACYLDCWACRAIWCDWPCTVTWRCVTIVAWGICVVIWIT